MHVWVHSIEKVSTSVSPRMGPAHHKYELVARNAAADVMKSKEDYFSKLEKSKKTDHGKRGHIIKSRGGKGNMSLKIYKSAVASAVKVEISNIKKDKEISDEL